MPVAATVRMMEHERAPSFAEATAGRDAYDRVDHEAFGQLRDESTVGISDRGCYLAMLSMARWAACRMVSDFADAAMRCRSDRACASFIFSKAPIAIST